MKKELIAAALLLLLFAGTLINIRVNDRLMGELKGSVSLAYSHAKDGDWKRAQETLSEACSRWHELDAYTHIFIRHSEIGSTTEAFYAMLSSVYAEDGGDLMGSYRLLSAQLDSIIGMEHISLGSIF